MNVIVYFRSRWYVSILRVAQKKSVSMATFADQFRTVVERDRLICYNTIFLPQTELTSF